MSYWKFASPHHLNYALLMWSHVVLSCRSKIEFSSAGLFPPFSAHLLDQGDLLDIIDLPDSNLDDSDQDIPFTSCNSDTSSFVLSSK